MVHWSCNSPSHSNNINNSIFPFILLSSKATRSLQTNHIPSRRTFIYITTNINIMKFSIILTSACAALVTARNCNKGLIYCGTTLQSIATGNHLSLQDILLHNANHNAQVPTITRKSWLPGKNILALQTPICKPMAR